MAIRYILVKLCLTSRGLENKRCQHFVKENGLLSYQVYMLWVLIAVNQLCDVGMIRNEIENLDLSLYVCHIFLLQNRANSVS